MYTHTHTYIDTHVYTYTYVHRYTCIHIHIRTYLHTYTHISTHSQRAHCAASARTGLCAFFSRTSMLCCHRSRTTSCALRYAKYVKRDQYVYGKRHINDCKWTVVQQKIRATKRVTIVDLIQGPWTRKISWFAIVSPDMGWPWLVGSLKL